MGLKYFKTVLKRRHSWITDMYAQNDSPKSWARLDQSPVYMIWVTRFENNNPEGEVCIILLCNSRLTECIHSLRAMCLQIS